MLFNSFEFIFFFLPILLIIYYVSKIYVSKKLSILIIIFASLFYYSWWNPIYLLLLGFSIIFNYCIGIILAKNHLIVKNKNNKYFLLLGVSTNIFLLSYFKYFGFFVDNFNHLTGTNIYINEMILPLAISFFTFQQIAFLVDAYIGQAKEYSFSNYCLFVTFFPQLIAGPIVHHKEMMPQFEKREENSFNPKDLSIGFIFFIIGLFKKVIIADNIGFYATPVFDSAEQNTLITFFEAWGGALAYNFQIYFDFSGYSDMAIGLGRMFGIIIPLNFNSPYKANNIIVFWRRWHITLSRFLKDYIYIPMGGNRTGKFRRYSNLMLTMLLGGLWHGASWTFVFWGILHGIYLLINHGFIVIRQYLKHDLSRKTIIGLFISRFITFISVTIAFVFFRAESLSGAYNIINGMFGFNGLNLDFRLAKYLPVLSNWIEFKDYHMGSLLNWSVPLIIVLWFVVWYFPNTQELIIKFRNTYNNFLKYNRDSNKLSLYWVPTVFIAIIFSILFLYTIINIGTHNEFIYYQF